MSVKRLAGHTFLALLGKRRLRPGGKKASEWLLNQIDFYPDIKVLEVACNQGTTAIEIVKRTGIQMTACDLDETALEIAEANAKKQETGRRIDFVLADARALPFDDESFDVVINEAMLTMLSPQDKAAALKEYHRVLKPGGLLLTHDVLFRTEDKDTQKEITRQLSKAIQVKVLPHDQKGWINTIEKEGFEDIEVLSGPMSLMNPKGMIQDEGFFNAFRIVRRGLSKPNREKFMTMFNTFKQYKNELGFVSIASKKQSYL